MTLGRLQTSEHKFDFCVEDLIDPTMNTDKK